MDSINFISLLEDAIDTVEFDAEKIYLAKQWSRENNIQMMYPAKGKELEEIWKKYHNLAIVEKKKADNQCVDWFGIDGDRLYAILSGSTQNIVELEPEENAYAMGQKMIQIEQVDPQSVKEEYYLNYNKKKIKENLIAKIEKPYKWEFLYAPYFTPEEITHLEGYYSNEVEEESNSFFIEYMNYFYGYNHSFDPVKWNNYLKQLQYKLEMAADEDTAEMYRQSIVKIGWNPEIPYNEGSIYRAKVRLESAINQMYQGVSMIDVSYLFEHFDEEKDEILSEKTNQKMYPISIVLVKGTAVMSNLISAATNGPFSHSAICIDDDFDRLYSFNMAHYSNKGGGLSLESIRTYPQDQRLGVFTFFVTKDVWETISSNIQILLNKIDQTRYSFANILTIPFSNINLNRDEKLICSQFVDRMLKLSNIDITNMDSSHVSPNYLYSVAIKNSKIYKVFDGITKNFNFKKASKFVRAMANKAKPIKESVIQEFVTNQYLYATISEARQIPIQVTNDGDVLLTNPLIDFKTEYYTIHKILLQYEKVKNIDGIKYELARLYYMNYILEKRIYNRKYILKKEENIKIRAKILNDFNKYMKFVLKYDPSFNFSAYYEDSPFYVHTVEIKSGTITKLKDLFSSIL